MARETTIDWPEMLGCPLRSSYAVQSGERFLEISVSEGPSRYRLKTSDEIRVYDVSFFWSAAQMEEWERFFKEDLNFGVEWFNMLGLVGGGMLPLVCHVVDNYIFNKSADTLKDYSVSFKIEAYRGPSAAPPVIAYMDPIDARAATNPAPDIYDAMTATDGINALGPGVWVS